MNPIAFGLMVLCSVAMAQNILPIGLPGPVPEFAQMQDFDGDLAQGKWYGTHYINYGIPPLPIHCWSFNGTSQEAGAIEAKVTLFLPLEIRTDLTIHVIPVPGEPAKFVMKELTKGPLKTTMVIPGTDYKTFFVKLDQFELAGAMHAISVNVYCRKPEMDDATFETVKALLQSIGITDEPTFVPQDCPAASFQDKVKGILDF